MNATVKNFVGVIIAVGVVGFVIAAWMYVDAFSKSIEPSSFRSFSVSAEGEINTIPDVAHFTFSVVTQGGTDTASLQQENIANTNKAIVFVKESGIENKDIKTQNFSLQPRYQNYSCPRPIGGESVACPPAEIVGYTMSQTVQVKVREDNFSSIGSIVSGVVDNGANSVSQLSFIVDDRDKSESDARTAAIEKAKVKAQAVAQAGGFKIGRLLSIQESGTPYYPIYDRAYEEYSGVAVSAQSATIEPGSQDVTVNVILVYEIQ